MICQPADASISPEKSLVHECMMSDLCACAWTHRQRSPNASSLTAMINSLRLQLQFQHVFGNISQESGYQPGTGLSLQASMLRCRCFSPPSPQTAGASGCWLILAVTIIDSPCVWTGKKELPLTVRSTVTIFCTSCYQEVESISLLLGFELALRLALTNGMWQK